MKIEGASALVAGGASGLGAATARALHERGATVLIADLNAEKGEALAAELGDRAQLRGDERDGARAGPGRRRRRGGGRRGPADLGLLRRHRLGAAGRVKQGPHDLEVFHNVVKVNLIGTFNVLRLACTAMNENDADEEGERGVCVNTASIAAFDGQIGQTAYAASKGGIVGLTLPAARDMASRGIRVNTIAPGLFDTPLLAALPQEARDALGATIPFPSRLGLPEEYADARRPHRREHDAQRRDDPPRRRPADGAEVVV